MIRYILRCWPIGGHPSRHLRHALGYRHHHHAGHVVRLVRCAWVAVPAAIGIGGALVPGWSSTGGASSVGGYSPSPFASEFGPAGFIGGFPTSGPGLGEQVAEAINNTPEIEMAGAVGEAGAGSALSPTIVPGIENAPPEIVPGSIHSTPEIPSVNQNHGTTPVSEPPLSEYIWLAALGMAFLWSTRRNWQ